MTRHSASPRPAPRGLRRRGRSLRGAVIVMLELALLVVLTAAAAATAGLLEPPAGRTEVGVTVGGVDVGGLDQAGVEARLRASLPHLEQLELVLPSGERRAVATAELGYGYDYAALADAALAIGRADDPFARIAARWQVFNGATSIAAVPYVDDEAINQALRRELADLEREPADARLAVDHDGVHLVAAVDGQRLDWPTLAAAARDALERGRASLEVQSIVVAPARSTAAAEAAAARARAMSDHELVIAYGDRQFAVSPAELRGWLLVTPTDRGFAVEPSPALVEIAVADIARAVDRPAIDASIEWDAGAYDFVVRPAQAGSVLYQPAATRSIVELLLERADEAPAGPSTLVIEPREDSPTRTEADVRDALDDARAAIRPLTLDFGSRRYIISRNQLAEVIRFGPYGTSSYDAWADLDALDEFIDWLADEVIVPAVEPRLVVADGAVTVDPGRDGLMLDRVALRDELDGALSRRLFGDAVGEVELHLAPLAVDQAELARLTELAAGMQMVSSFTTSFVPGLTNFNGRNITIPADIISGTVLEPGQRFDFFDSIGEINEERGYGPGGVIINGKPEPTGAIGGGICSTSTTLFNAAMRYGLQIDKRRAHSYYISRYPLGLDATVFRSPWSRQTMAFTNDTPYPILIHASHTEKTVTFELYSIPAGRQVVLSEPEVSEVERAVIRRQYTSDLPRGRARLLQEPHDKMKVIIRRTVLGPSGEILHEDVFRSRYIRVDGIMLVGR